MADNEDDLVDYDEDEVRLVSCVPDSVRTQRRLLATPGKVIVGVV